MAGGPSTPALVTAAARAGGLGFLAGGYKTAQALAERLVDQVQIE
jgi:NAD(P)H-dependent flavin oxidoreductase YrpB (nitropropane dioxygenase family)